MTTAQQLQAGDEVRAGDDTVFVDAVYDDDTDSVWIDWSDGECGYVGRNQRFEVLA